MLVNSGSNAFGCFFIASASDAPLSTSARVARMTDAKFLSSSCVPRISRHCTSGRPASIITENWRVKTARFFALTLLARWLGGLGRRFLDRVDLRDEDLLAAQRGDRGVHRVGDALAGDVCPCRVRPLYANVAITCYSTTSAAGV